mgnify:CR=1 FL=1
MAIFEGAGVALVTPFKENGEVNYEKLEEIVEEQIAGAQMPSLPVGPRERLPPCPMRSTWM